MTSLKVFWNSIKKEILKKYLVEILKQAFNPYPYRIIAKKTDSLTKRAHFKIKCKRVVMPLVLSTDQLMLSDKYILGTCSEDRAKIIEQFRNELIQPLAYISEFPLHVSPGCDAIFKVLDVVERKIIVGTSEYFLLSRKDIINKLGRDDLIQIVMTYKIVSGCDEKL